MKPEINHSYNSMNIDSPHPEQLNFRKCSIQQHNNILDGRSFFPLLASIDDEDPLAALDTF